MEDIYLVGASTTAIRVVELIKYHKLYNIKGFIVDDNYKNTDEYYGLPLLSLSEFKQIENYIKIPIFICIGWNRLNLDRKNVFESFKEFNLINIISPTAIIRGEVLGRNIYIGDNCIIDIKTKIFDNVFLDHNVFLGYNVTIRKHAFLGVRTVFGGSVVVGEQCFVGMGALIFDKTIVGNRCIISGGEIIKRNTVDNCTIRSKDGKQITKVYSEDEIINKLIAVKNVR